MFSKTRFSQILNLFPHDEYANLVDKYQTDKHSKGFNSRSHLVAMIYGQLAGADSLRTLTTAFNAHRNCHYHLGMKSINKSTLSDANRSRNADVFEAMCTALMSTAQRGLRRDVKELLYLLDSSPIVLNGRGFEWAQSPQKLRVAGLKLHLLFAPKGAMPCKVKVGPSKQSDISYAQSMVLESAAMYVFDKGYYDYNWWYKIDQKGSNFVTRFKSNAGILRISDRSIEGCEDDILSDQIVTFKNRRPGGSRINHYHGTPLRKVVVKREDKNRPLVIATNDMTRSADEIAALYKQRWGIELMFKWLKQRLKIKKFYGRSENAVRIQIYVALITYLLLHRLRQLSGSKKDFYLWFAEFRVTMFDRNISPYRDQERRSLRRIAALQRQSEIPI